jgi:hypothetical protein
MKKNMLATLIITLSGFSTAGFAQDQLPQLTSTTEAQAAVRTVYEAFDKQEIAIDGYIGTFIGDGIYFLDQTGRYEVTLDAGRAVRKDLANCKIGWGYSGNHNCSAQGMAEVHVSWDASDLSEGMKVKLIIYELQITHR